MFLCFIACKGIPAKLREIGAAPGYAYQKWVFRLVGCDELSNMYDILYLLVMLLLSGLLWREKRIIDVFEIWVFIQLYKDDNMFSSLPPYDLLMCQ